MYGYECTRASQYIHILMCIYIHRSSCIHIYVYIYVTIYMYTHFRGGKMCCSTDIPFDTSSSSKGTLDVKQV